MEGILTEDEALQDLADWLYTPEPDPADGWRKVTDIAVSAGAHVEWIRRLCREKVEEGTGEMMRYKKADYFRRIDGE